MKKYIITYHLRPEAEDITIEYVAASEEEAIIYAKSYKDCAFSIKEDSEVS